MTIKKLSETEISYIYQKHMVTDFDKDELKPLNHILKLLDSNIYFCYGLYENTDLKAYAFFCGRDKHFLLDYYAVCSGIRNSGVGSKFIKLLGDFLPKNNIIIAETEAPMYAKDKNDKIIREKRISFYEKNGFKKTNIACRLFNVNFLIIYLPPKNNPNDINDNYIYSELNKIYTLMFTKKIADKNIKLQILTED